jgi:putative transposase
MRLKGRSAREINLKLGRTGPVWQEAYFDRMLRRSENLLEKTTYVCENPVRASLASDVEEYPWKWRRWLEGSDVRFVLASRDGRRAERSLRTT